MKAASPSLYGRRSPAVCRRRGGGGQPLPQPAVAFRASSRQRGAGVTPALRQEPFLCPFPAAFAGAAALSEMPFAPMATKGNREQGWFGGARGPCRGPRYRWGTSTPLRWHPEVTRLETRLLFLYRRPTRSPGKTPESGTVHLSDSVAGWTTDAITEISSRQGSRSCDSTTQLEIKSNHRLQDTY